MDIPNLYYVVPYPLCVLCGFIHVLCGSIPSLCTMWVHTCTMWFHTFSVYYVGSYLYYVGPYPLCVLCGFIHVLCGSIPSLCTMWVHTFNNSLENYIEASIILQYNFKGIWWLCGSIMGNSISVIGKFLELLA